MVGPAHVLTGNAAAGFELAHPMAVTVVGGHATSGSTGGDLNGARAAVVKPGSAQELATILKLCFDAGVPTIARGAGTSLTGGVVPSPDAVIVSSERLNNLVVDSANACAIAGAGVATAKLKSEAAAAGFMYPPDPGSMEISSIGGTVATNGGGARGLKYGITRDYVLGMVVVLSDGRTLRLGGKTRRRAAGYSLMQLFIGSEGTLGIISEVTLKLVPLATCRACALVGFRNLSEVQEALTRVLTSGPIPSGLEVLDRTSLALVDDLLPSGLDRDLSAALLLEQDGYDADRVLAELLSAVERIGGVDSSIAQSERECERLWTIVESVGAAARRASPNALLEDISVPPARVTDMIRRLEALAQLEGIRIATKGHAGEGSLHPWILLDDRHGATAQKLRLQVLRAAKDLGGSIAGEYGIGLFKRDFSVVEFEPAALALMSELKQLVDPKRLLNPGKVFAARRANKVLRGLVGSGEQ